MVAAASTSIPVIVLAGSGAAVPIIEIQVNSPEHLAALLQNPELARLALSGKLLGVPAERSEAPLQSHESLAGSSCLQFVQDFFQFFIEWLCVVGIMSASVTVGTQSDYM